MRELAQMLRFEQRPPQAPAERSVRGWMLATAALFGIVYVLRLSDQDARNGIAFLYALPVAALALRFGLRGGLIGAAFAMLLVLADGNPELVLSHIGHGTRAAILFAVGASIGWFVDREHRWHRLRLERVETERRTSAAQMLSAQERERVRLARELHDEIGQSITGLMLEIDRVAKQAPESIENQLRETQEAAREISDELRTIVRRLRPEALDQLGLNRALIALSEKFAEQSSLVIERRFAKDLPPLSSDAELVIYRVAQESLTNVARHAGATRVELELRSLGNAAELRVADDGDGLPAGTTPGSGIQGMRERAMLVEAKVWVRSHVRGGTEVVMQVPAELGTRHRPAEGHSEPEPGGVLHALRT